MLVLKQYVVLGIVLLLIAILTFWDLGILALFGPRYLLTGPLRDHLGFLYGMSCIWMYFAYLYIGGGLLKISGRDWAALVVQAFVATGAALPSAPLVSLVLIKTLAIWTLPIRLSPSSVLIVAAIGTISFICKIVVWRHVVRLIRIALDDITSVTQAHCGGHSSR